MKIGIAAGHSKNTEGERLWEHCLCHRIGEALVEPLTSCGHTVITPLGSVYEKTNDDALRAKIKLFNCRKVDVAVELHINAGGGRYATCLYHRASAQGRELAQRTVRPLASLKAFSEWTSIGARTQDSMGRQLAFLNQTTMPAVIIEPGFKDFLGQRAFFDSQSAPVILAELIHIGLEMYGAGRAEVAKSPHAILARPL